MKLRWRILSVLRLLATQDSARSMAWHFGWEPAVQVSGASWIPPVLAQLLDDPYAAVRCVAERSLKQVAPSLIPADYDYTAPPDSRPSVQGLVLERWSKRNVHRAWSKLAGVIRSFA